MSGDAGYRNAYSRFSFDSLSLAVLTERTRGAACVRNGDEEKDSSREYQRKIGIGY